MTLSIASSFSAIPIPALWALSGLGRLGKNGMSGIGKEGIQVEPNPDGDGITLMATNTQMFFWIDDPAGMASESFVLDVCEQMATACEIPEIQRPHDCNGDEWDIELPAWMMPDKVTIVADRDNAPHSRWAVGREFGHCVTLVHAKALPEHLQKEGDEIGGPTLFSMGRSHGHSQTIERKLINWRKMIPAGEPQPMVSVSLFAPYLVLLRRLGMTAMFRFYGPGKPIRIDFADNECAHAMIMPMELTNVPHAR